MGYAVLSDVVTRYRPISTMIGSEQYDVSTTDVYSIFIAQAEGYVDGWLARRYVTPLSLTPPLVTQITADLAIHAMLAEKLPSIPEFIDKRYERATDILEKLADGKMTLGNSVTVVSSQGDNYAWANGMDHHPIFSPVLGELDQTPDAQRVSEDTNERLSDVSS